MGSLFIKFKTSFIILIASFILSCVAFYNGYPLVYPDTSSYIGLQENLLRSFIYNLFISLTSFTHSLWPVAFLQSLITAHILYLVMRVVFELKSNIIYLSTIVLMCLLTNLPWFTGFIMPDIFTGVMILSLFLMLFCFEKLNSGEKKYLFIMTTCAAAFHLTNIPLAIGIILMFFIYNMCFRNKIHIPLSHFLNSLLAVSFAMLLIIVSNYHTTGVFTFSPGGYAFPLTRLVSDGTAVKYLQKSCPNKKYKLCAYLDQLPTEDYDTFLWSEESSFHKVGWIKGYKDEGSEIVKNTIIDYPFLFLKHSLKNSVIQLTMINNYYGICSYINNPFPTDKIKESYPDDFNAYATSKQSLNKLHLNSFNRLHRMIICLSLFTAVVIFLLFLKQRQYFPLQLLVFIVCAYLISSMITATFNEPHNRYGSRIIWLLPFFSIAAVMNFVKHWKEYYRIIIKPVI